MTADPAAVERLPSWPDSRLRLTPAARWLLDHNGEVMPMAELFEGFCRHLVDEGLPLLRVSTGLPSMHPQTYTRGFSWTRGQGVTVVTRGHDVRESPEYLNSPVHAIHMGAAAVRRRLDIPGVPLDFGVLPDLIAIGATDYIALPMRFTQGPGMSHDGSANISFMSFVTDRPGGFRPEELSYLMELMPLIALRLELEAARGMTRDLLTTYLGSGPAKRVLKGDFMRGRGYEVEAAIWLSDLRGFTAYSDRHNPQEVVTTLDSYFDAMSGPIQAHDGEVLKFIGDGLLAIFRVDPDSGGRAAACHRALEAAQQAFAELHELNQGRAIGGEPPLKIGLALHVGRVVFGNIGAKDRLDFTVIGRAVNEVARVEAMTKVLDRPVLASAAFAREVSDCPIESLGFHGLRGVQEPQELFGLPAHCLAGYE
ncbi:adenylate/guanylate cyclase domain-containing protein [Ferrovibrio sp.]|uniref:adenylate/guanylate cyclase domain-containing protein n=1 Tax=Ferrovibrio sp. TaxID=1917215 RepID=UPI003517F982